MKILNKTESKNELLGRSESKLVIEFDGATPSKKDVSALAVKELKAKEELLVVREIVVKYGTDQAEVEIFVYDNAETKSRVENLTMHKKIQEKLDAQAEKDKAAAEAKKAEEEAKKAAEAEAAAAAKEAPAEESAEEEKGDSE